MPGKYYLTVGDLRELLNAIDPEHDDNMVVLSEDAEGNGFSPLVEAEQAIYQPIRTWMGERGHLEDGEDAWSSDPAEWTDIGYEDHPELKPRRALILWPVN